MVAAPLSNPHPLAHAVTEVHSPILARLCPAPARSCSGLPSAVLEEVALAINAAADAPPGALMSLSTSGPMLRWAVCVRALSQCV